MGGLHSQKPAMQPVIMALHPDGQPPPPFGDRTDLASNPSHSSTPVPIAAYPSPRSGEQNPRNKKAQHFPISSQSNNYKRKKIPVISQIL
jgi:hypothetical protein